MEGERERTGLTSKAREEGRGRRKGEQRVSPKPKNQTSPMVIGLTA